MTINFKSYGNSNNRPIIIIHGLFGSSQNWTHISKELGINNFVISVDCRNHGDSFHSNSMSYKEMAEDIITLMEYLSQKKATLIGHSMGGKVSMACAQLYPEKIVKQIIIDIAPKQYPPHHNEIINALTKINLSDYETRQHVNADLKQSIPNDVLRQFLIKNISPKTPLEWRINLIGIARSYHHIMNWPDSFTKQSSIPSLFICGKKSNYVESNDHKYIQTIFLNSVFETLDASHWVHAEKTNETIKLIRDFLN